MSGCRACGAALEADDRFCGECGATVEVAARGAGAAAAGRAPAAGPGERTHAAAPRAAGGVLYVLPEAAPRALETFLGGRGEVLRVGAGEQAALGAVQARLAGALPEAVCLLGADHELPMCRLADPSGNDDAVLTDNFYGRRASPSEAERFTGELLPEVPVSRIPSLDPALVLRLHDDAEGLAAGWGQGFALSAAVWEVASRGVAERLYGAAGPRLLLAPPADHAQVAAALGRGPGRLYFNVHGSGDEPVWVGEGPGKAYPRVLGLDIPSVAPRAIVVSEACYGAMVFPEDGGIGERFLRAGAGAFVGSSIIAWGGAAGSPPMLADLIVTGFYDALDGGAAAGAALLEAKRALLAPHLEAGEALEPSLHNTLLTFVHYGAPLARVPGAARKAPAAPAPRALGPAAPRGPGGGSALDRIRARMGGAAGGSALGGARDRIAARLSPAEYRTLSAGRVALAQLPAEFRGHAQITAELSGLLGAPPSDLHVFRYQAGPRRLAQLTARHAGPDGLRRLAALVVADDGTALRRYVSR